MIGGPNLGYAWVEPSLTQCIIAALVAVFGCACSECPSFFGGDNVNILYTCTCLLRLLPRAHRRLPPWHDPPHDDPGNPVYEALQYASGWWRHQRSCRGQAEPEDGFSHHIRTVLGEVNALDRRWLKTLFPRYASGAIFLRHRPPPYTTVTESARTPAATESKTIETQPKTTRYRKRRSRQGWTAWARRATVLHLLARPPCTCLHWASDFGAGFWDAVTSNSARRWLGNGGWQWKDSQQS